MRKGKFHMGDKTTRREFLRQMAIAGAAFSVLSGVAEAAEAVAKGSGKSRVVVATDKAVFSNGTVNKSVLGKMLGSSMAKLTDTKSGAAAWKKLFSPKDVVGIKVNCLFGPGVSTRPDVVAVVIENLKSAGVKEDNIIVWDRSTSDLIKCGFIPNAGKGVKVFADDDKWGPEIEQGAFKGKISTVLSEKVTAFINMPVLKTHGITGISCCLKNHYGSFNNPGSHHRNHCTPAIADFSSIPMVKEKARLVVVDAIRPQHSGGPGLQDKDQFNYYSIMVGFDPVAVDYHGVGIIQAELAKTGKQPIPDSKLIWLAAAQERGVGTCDPGKIEVMKA